MAEYGTGCWLSQGKSAGWLLWKIEVAPSECAAELAPPGRARAPVPTVAKPTGGGWRLRLPGRAGRPGIRRRRARRRVLRGRWWRPNAGSVDESARSADHARARSLAY